MANLRCISFSMDYCWRLRESEKDKLVKPYTLTDLLVYNFYLPLFANGPVVTFDTFQKTVSGLIVYGYEGKTASITRQLTLLFLNVICVVEIGCLSQRYR